MRSVSVTRESQTEGHHAKDEEQHPSDASRAVQDAPPCPFSKKNEMSIHEHQDHVPGHLRGVHSACAFENRQADLNVGCGASGAKSLPQPILLQLGKSMEC